MGKIALAIMVVGLCFYQVYWYQVSGKEDSAAALISLAGAIILLFNWKDKEIKEEE